MVTITILDVNDNAPIFLSASYEARVNENQPLGTTITLVEKTLTPQCFLQFHYFFVSHSFQTW